MEALFNGAIDHFPEIELPQINPKAPMTDQDADKVGIGPADVRLRHAVFVIVRTKSKFLDAAVLDREQRVESVGRIQAPNFGLLRAAAAPNGCPGLLHCPPLYRHCRARHFYERTQATCLSGQGL